MRKQRTLHEHEAPSYWLLDPERKTLTVMRWQADGYVTLQVAGPGETVRAEPFEAIDLEIDELLGDV